MNLELTGLGVAIDLHDFRRLRAAEGYIELGMYDDADTELEQVDPFCAASSRVLALKLCAYAGQAKWKLMGMVAKKLTERDPSEVQWAIWWAYAAAKGQGINRAKNILIQALRNHPNDSRLHYAMGCYESRLHHFNTAKRHLARAIQLDSGLKLVALSDEELEPLWSVIEQLDT
jgi:tetratricopeptide (TPR) repeat protein